MAKTLFPFFLKSSHKIRLGSKINSPCIASRWRSIQNNFPNLKGEYEKQKLQDWCDTSDCVGWIKTKVLSATDRKGWWAHWRWDQVMRDLQAKQGDECQGSVEKLQRDEVVWACKFIKFTKSLSLFGQKVSYWVETAENRI